ncbi:hypothetical protein PENTCL1PPCAC_19751, partial [Pristionchus entomophagus]
MGKARVFLGRIPYAARVRDIEDFFRGYGKINDISLKTGFAFVEFDRSRDGEDAIDNLNGRSILGDRVVVELAKGTPLGGDAYRFEGRRSPRPSSSSRRSRSRSHSRSRDRKRSHSRRSRSRSRSKHSRRICSPRRRSRSSSASSRSKSRCSPSRKKNKKTESHRSRS